YIYFCHTDTAHTDIYTLSLHDALPIFNNAGYGQFGMIEEISEAEARAQFETNLFGALWITQAALPYLREQGSGHILQVSSIGGIDRKSTRLNSSHDQISYAVFCLKKKK